jgi:hypothetical protein
MNIRDMFTDLVSTVRQINRKYAHPALKTGRGVQISLLILRVYLIVLVGLLFVKFFLSLKSS